MTRPASSETMSLESLRNTTRPKKRRKLLGRGIGSGKGKTCGRGVKGAGSRSGWKARHGAEGGGTALYRRIPTRGFSNAQFSQRFDVINLGQIEMMYNDGESVSLETLREKRFITGPSYGVKVLGKGVLTKKVTFDVQAFSESAKEKLKEAGISI